MRMLENKGKIDEKRPKNPKIAENFHLLVNK